MWGSRYHCCTDLKTGVCTNPEAGRTVLMVHGSRSGIWHASRSRSARLLKRAEFRSARILKRPLRSSRSSSGVYLEAARRSVRCSLCGSVSGLLRRSRSMAELWMAWCESLSATCEDLETTLERIRRPCANLEASFAPISKQATFVPI